MNEDVGSFEPAVTLDVDQIEAIDEDVRDGRVAQQRFERTEAEELVQHVGDKRFALERLSGVVSLLRFDEIEDDAADLRLRFLLAHLGQPLEIQAVQQIVVDLAP